MKTLNPSSKERKRYILIKLVSDLKFEKDDVLKLVLQAGLQFLGELGMAQAGIQFITDTWNKDKMTGIIRTNHNKVDETKASLAFIKEYKGKPVTITCLKVSGAMEKLK